MKNNIKFKALGLLLLTLTVVGCNGYIDIIPENNVPVAQVDYTNMSGAFMPVSGIYSKANYNLTSWPTYALMTVRGDDTEKGCPDPSDQAVLTEMHEFNYANMLAYWAVNDVWKTYYEVIMSANLALVSLDKYDELAAKTEADKALIASYKAEVRFFRAYAHFFATRLWGDVPLITDNAAADGIEKTKNADILAWIVQEMKECADVLPELRPNEAALPGSVTKYTVLALQAKAASDLGDYPTVLAATNKIVDDGRFSLYQDYYELFKMPGKLSNESLYEAQFSNFNQTSGDSKYPNCWYDFQGPAQPFVSAKKFDGGNMAGGWGFLPVSSKLYNLMKARGETKRFEATVLEIGTTTRSGDYLSNEKPYPAHYSGKAYLPSVQILDGRNWYGSGNNIRMIRYADILLLNAEAKVASGQSGDTPFNEVRRRAGMTELNGVTLEQIAEERFVELGCEWGERFYDLVRTKKAATMLAGQGNGYSDAKQFYPIPLEQIDLNSNLGK